jgi:transposase
MTPVDIRASVLTLHQQAISLREISRLLHLSRNTVRGILREPSPVTSSPASVANEVSQQQLSEVYARAKGNAVRMAQILADEYDQHPPYSTLTRWVREAELRASPKRSGEYHFEPGQEMQHDTSPHKMEVGGKAITAQCAGLTLAYSRRLFIWYYPRFTRFEAKDFLLRAALFMDGTCPRCVIDNTSVMLAGGAGPDAVFAPEMAAFARALGFKFMAHRVNDPDRKARIERPFAWIEGNFLPGRSFASFDDVNAQALAWCTEVANAKPKRSLGMAPEAAYVMEKPYLTRLSAVLPAVYEVFERVVDLYGFVSVDTNRYSTPERLVGKTVTVYKHYASIEIHYKRALVASHPRLVGVRDVRSTLSGHHTIPKRTPREPSLQAQLLCGQSPVIDAYVTALIKHLNGRGTRALNRLLQLKRTYPAQPFMGALQQALKYGLFDLTRLENLVLRHVAGDFFALDDHSSDHHPETQKTQETQDDEQAKDDSDTDPA